MYYCMLIYIRFLCKTPCDPQPSSGHAGGGPVLQNLPPVRADRHPAGPGQRTAKGAELLPLDRGGHAQTLDPFQKKMFYL